MENISILDENWHVLLSLFPPNWRELAKETGAMVRKFRSFTSEDNLMRTLLIHIAQGYSLRETVVKAKASNIADISDVALLKRLKLSEHWFKELCQLLLKDKGVFIDKTDNSQAICMKLVDATNVKEPGKTAAIRILSCHSREGEDDVKWHFKIGQNENCWKNWEFMEDTLQLNST